MSSRLDIRIPFDLKNRFEEVAKEQGKSMSDVIRELIEMYTAMAENGIDVARLIKEVIEQGKEESKLILTIDVSRRYPGCGWVYLWREYVLKLLGEVEVIELQYSDNSDMCQKDAKVAIIPLSVPIILAKYSEDDDPNASNELTIFIFDGKSWRSVTVDLGDKTLSFDRDMVIYSL